MSISTMQNGRCCSLSSIRLGMVDADADADATSSAHPFIGSYQSSTHHHGESGHETGHLFSSSSSRACKRENTLESKRARARHDQSSLGTRTLASFCSFPTVGLARSKQRRFSKRTLELTPLPSSGVRLFIENDAFVLSQCSKNIYQCDCVTFPLCWRVWYVIKVDADFT
mmetsp:Transcript_36249/g.108685  ORF Transcript_36249/g.108685 Transcript_36249/m.108685 type:complete len:170 (-) Transcript_36249:2341-2850(-)